MSLAVPGSIAPAKWPYATEPPVNNRRLGPCGLRSLPRETAAIIRRPAPAVLQSGGVGQKRRTTLCDSLPVLFPCECQATLAALVRRTEPATALVLWQPQRSQPPPTSALPDATACFKNTAATCPAGRATLDRNDTSLPYALTRAPARIAHHETPSAVRKGHPAS